MFTTRRFSLAILLAGFAAGFSATAAPPTLFFEHADADGTIIVALGIAGDKITGTRTWRPASGAPARGTIRGTIHDGIITANYDGTVDGRKVSEQQIYRLEDARLLVGRGELQDRGDNGRLTLKDPAAVTFPVALRRVDVQQLTPGTPERQAIMDAMRGAVTKRIGQPVAFTGDVRVSGTWATFQGRVTATNGRPATTEAGVAEMETDFFALLERDGETRWTVRQWGFAADVNLIATARAEHPQLPLVMFE